MFSGPPGTGKTLSAQIVAAELGLDLLTVDLSALVSKWLGESLLRVLSQPWDRVYGIAGPFGTKLENYSKGGAVVGGGSRV